MIKKTEYSVNMRCMRGDGWDTAIRMMDDLKWELAVIETNLKTIDGMVEELDEHEHNGFIELFSMMADLSQHVDTARDDAMAMMYLLRDEGRNDAL